ncbi:iron-containing alcohol dehydrogenase [Jiella sp. MQZ9-1]|uniref:Iron-containing alcohol dehydrogenase n=1 Tax=Jiella flava TaxID=2816857 RepID=A0A939FVV9_9HYPH|nr:iron-containing alcohol dehydrogenase [Jiella flava]MBO0662918.1 iron-containing alcohol dehydrogenase [Jiella flava]MCD2471322.1 iron-containing alcohol dehydrogenase [Jiella flava]
MSEIGAAHRSGGGRWTTLIDEIIDGSWLHPDTGKPAIVDYESVVIAESLEGREADLVASMRLGDRLALVADAATYEAMGARIERALAGQTVTAIILDHPHADIAHVADLRERLKGCSGAIAVGSGTINDLTKFVIAEDRRPYCVFGTAASMNGYTSSTASITVESGLKVSLPSIAPRGFFVDLTVSAEAPRHLAAAGFGDCMARSVAQIDWWVSHRLLGSRYEQVPYTIQMADEAELNRRAAGVKTGDIAAIGYLYRVLTLCGLGISFTGISNHGSMGEHQISHYIDCFAGERHPGTLHGQQVGVASLTLARLQQQMLASPTPPRLRATRIDRADMERRMGPAIAAECFAEVQKKALDADAAAQLNARMDALWPQLREECQAFMLPVAEMDRLLEAAGAPRTAADLGVPVEFYREAVIHCREMRNRFSCLDLAADSGLLDDFAAGEM